MHDQAGWLVDDDQVIVGVHHRELDGRVGRRRFGDWQKRRVDANDLTLTNANFTDGVHLAIDERSAGSHQDCCVAAAAVGHQRHDAVETLATQGCRDLLFDHVTASCLLNNDHRTNITPPTFTAISATLKIGNH